MILFVNYSNEFGGGERLLLDFAGGLDGELALACPEGHLAREARSRGMAVFPIPSRSLRLRDGMLAAAGRLAAHGVEIRRLARKLAPELVIAWGMRSALASVGGPRPLVFQHNDLLPSPLVARAVRAVAARADLTLALSDAIAHDLDPEGRLGSRLAVVHPGVDVSRFEDGGRPGGPPKVLVLGAITGWKRPDLAVQACELAHVRHPSLRLRLVGAPVEDDRLFEQLSARGQALDWLELPGAVADPAGELARAYCLLHCADREPFGMAVLEALAAGRPAVVPASAGAAEIVDSSCGVLYEPGDAGAAAEALVSLLDDPERASALGAAGRARARDVFGLQGAQRRYREALLRVRS